MPANKRKGRATLDTDSDIPSDGQDGRLNFFLKLLQAFDKLQQRIRHEVLLFALGYLLLLIGMMYTGDRIVIELKILITLLPFVALIVYAFVVSQRDTSKLDNSSFLLKRNRRNEMNSNVSDRDQYNRLLGHLNRLTENEFLDVKQHLLKIEEINTGSGTSRVHFMGDMRVMGKMDSLEKYLLENYQERIVKK